MTGPPDSTRMRHLIISREYPPSTYPRGGIGTYVEQIARLLAEAGETVHVIGELWDGASSAREIRYDGRLIVHRVPLGEPLHLRADAGDAAATRRLLDGMAASAFPAQTFAWQAAMLAETLVDAEAIDVIEAQDYEAPLSYFLLRRALGPGACCGGGAGDGDRDALECGISDARSGIGGLREWLTSAPQGDAIGAARRVCPPAPREPEDVEG